MAERGAAKAVIYDTDMGSDDWLAALLLLCSPAVDVKAITVTGAGLASLRYGPAHALGLADLAGKTHVPVAGGRDKPLRGDNTFPTRWRDETDVPPGLTMPPSDREPDPRPAAEVLAAAPAGTVLVATGPLTNVAEALRIDPSLAGRLAMIYVMGGALRVPGNVKSTWKEIDNEKAEWNFYVDPLAAAEVLASGAPVTLVPLDATDKAPVTPEFCCRLGERLFTRSAKFAYDVLSLRFEDVKKGKYFFWDALAAAVAIDERYCPDVDETRVVIEQAPPNEGQTREDAAGSPVRACFGADRQAFERLFLDTLGG
jgi:pyrimidine-specific ribonucleoside hydrolase